MKCKEATRQKCRAASLLYVCRPSSALCRIQRAGNGTRTRDPNLGKVVLYQLSYSRNTHYTSKIETRSDNYKR